MSRLGAVLASLLVALPALAGFHSKPGVYEVHEKPVHMIRGHVDFTYVKPLEPRSPALLVLFATGDAGWMGTSGTVFEHMADEGFYLAGFSSRQLVKHVKRTGKLIEIPEAAGGVDAVLVEARRTLGLPATTPVVVTGFSRGANLVVFAAGAKNLQDDVAGAIAMALTHETDYFQAPPAADLPEHVRVDEKGRMQTYPAIQRAGSIPFAVIQSKGDSYVPAEEARRLFGPDSPTRRLYQVDARSHGFGGGQEELLHDLDDALGWIEGAARTK